MTLHRSILSRRPRLAPLASVLALAACGGGGSEPATPADAPEALSDAPTMRALAAASSSTPGWFVDSRNGNDANDGSFDRPWRTLARLADVQASAAKPVFLRCDSVWRETLLLGPAQLAPGAVVQPYGSCSGSTATVNGSDDVSKGWTKSGNVWSRNIGGGRGVTQVFVDGKAHRVARWPNAPGSQVGFAITDDPGTATNASLTVAPADAAVLSTQNLAGAKVYLRTGGAASQTLPVKGLDAGTRRLLFNGTSSRNIAAGHGYVVLGQRWMLDAPGEFFYDEATGQLSIYPFDSGPQGDLNAARVEASVRDTAIEIRNVASVTVRGIGVVKARRDGLLAYDAPQTSLLSITGIDNGRSGAAVVSSDGQDGSAGSRVQDGVFVRNSLYGIDASGSAKVTIRNNAVKDTGMGIFLGLPMAGIWSGPGSTVEANTVQRSGLTGIRFAGAGGTRIAGNVVVESCLRFSDCGAIYTWNGPKRTDWKSGQSSLVQGNVVSRAPVDLTGSGPNPPAFNAGIYYDVFSAGATAKDNAVSDVPVGVKLHNSSTITVAGNRIAGVSAAALWANMDDPSFDYMTGNVFDGNQLAPASMATGSFPAVPTAQPSYAVWFWHKILGSGAVANGSNLFRNNTAVQLNDPAMPVAWFHGADGERYLLADEWAALAPQDQDARRPAEFALYLPTLGGDLVGNGRFDAGLGDWTAWFADVGGLLGSLVATALPGCSGTCAKFTALSVNDTLISPSFKLQAGAMYQVGYTASFTTPGSASKPGVVGDSSNAGLASKMSSTAVLNGLPGQTLAYSGLFTATASESATLRLAAAPGTTVGFDNVSLRPVTDFGTSTPGDWMRTAWAANQPATVSCASFGWPSDCGMLDLDGQAVALPLTLPAFSARTLLRADSPWRVR